jgi:hypothetical protein
MARNQLIFHEELHIMESFIGMIGLPCIYHILTLYKIIMLCSALYACYYIQPYM